MGIDIFLFEYIFELTGNYRIDFLAHFLAKFLPYGLIAVLVLLSIKDRVYYLKTVLQGIALGFVTKFLIVLPIEHFIPRERPFVAYGFDPLVPRSPSPAFPSSHAAFFFALSTVIFFKSKKLGIFFYISSFLIIIARIYTGLHWPSDVLVGSLIGVVFGLVYQKIKEYNQ